MRVLDRTTVEELLDRDELVAAVADAMADLSLGRASVPPRIAARVDQSRLLATMPAYSETLGVLAAKLLTVYAENEASGFPVHQAAIAVFDPENGQLLAIMDGDVVTAARTAACSALSVRLLARPDSRVLAVLGTGPQARAHALYAAPMRPFEEIRLGGRNPAKVAALADDLAAEGLPVRGCGLDEAIAGADVVCATTSAIEPLLRRGNVRPGTHIASVGYRPNGGEVEPALLLESLIVVEHRATALQPFPAGANDLVELVESGALHTDDLVEIGELVVGSRPGRRDDEQITVYKSVGLAVQDAAAAAVVLSAATRAGAGVEVAL